MLCEQCRSAEVDRVEYVEVDFWGSEVVVVVVFCGVCEWSTRVETSLVVA